MKLADAIELYAYMGEPVSAQPTSMTHYDPIPTYSPPSLVKRKKQQRVPADNPGEEDDRFLDVTKRLEKARERLKLLKHQGPSGAGLPVTTTAIQHHTGSPRPFGTWVPDTG